MKAGKPSPKTSQSGYGHKSDTGGSVARDSRTPRQETAGPPRRRRGGQELPDNVQDRPEQNAGYDAAVRGERVRSPRR